MGKQKGLFPSSSSPPCCSRSSSTNGEPCLRDGPQQPNEGGEENEGSWVWWSWHAPAGSASLRLGGWPFLAVTQGQLCFRRRRGPTTLLSYCPPWRRAGTEGRLGGTGWDASRIVRPDSCGRLGIIDLLSQDHRWLVRLLSLPPWQKPWSDLVSPGPGTAGGRTGQCCTLGCSVSAASPGTNPFSRMLSDTRQSPQQGW